MGCTASIYLFFLNWSCICIELLTWQWFTLIVYFRVASSTHFHFDIEIQLEQLRVRESHYLPITPSHVIRIRTQRNPLKLAQPDNRSHGSQPLQTMEQYTYAHARTLRPEWTSKLIIIFLFFFGWFNCLSGCIQLHTNLKPKHSPSMPTRSRVSTL